MPLAPILALWTAPRTASTAFERMMIERGDVRVVHEPFSLRYYFGPDKHSDRFDDIRPESTPAAIMGDLEACAGEAPVFVKDMAYHVRDLADAGFLARFTNTFLIRDPAWTLPSLGTRWPDFTDEEAGFEALESLVEAVASDGADPCVVDSDDLRADPEGIVRAYCAAVGLPFLRDALTWEPGMPKEWGLWQEWHTDAAASDGFLPTSGSPPPRDTPRLVAAYEHCAPIYERLHARRVRSVPDTGRADP